jgi:hypothetical protein
MEGLDKLDKLDRLDADEGLLTESHRIAGFLILDTGFGNWELGIVSSD